MYFGACDNKKVTGLVYKVGGGSGPHQHCASSLSLSQVYQAVQLDPVTNSINIHVLYNVIAICMRFI